RDPLDLMIGRLVVPPAEGAPARLLLDWFLRVDDRCRGRLGLVLCHSGCAPGHPGPAELAQSYSTYTTEHRARQVRDRRYSQIRKWTDQWLLGWSGGRGRLNCLTIGIAETVACPDRPKASVPETITPSR